jgi:hypothetical protein
MRRAIGITLEGDRWDGDGGRQRQPLLQIVILRLAFFESQTPAVIVDDDRNMIGIGESGGAALEGRVVEIPFGRRGLPNEPVSSTQVIRSFSSATGMPPHSYLVGLRVERAKSALRSGLSPAAAALDVGFSDQSQLTRHFKRLTGVMPGRFTSMTDPRATRAG